MLLESMSAEERKNTLANGQKGVSNWLTTLLLKEYGLDLSKQEFRDAIRLRYGWVLERLPLQIQNVNSFLFHHDLEV